MSSQPPIRSNSSISATVSSISAVSSSARSTVSTSSSSADVVSSSSISATPTPAATTIRHQEDRLGLTWRTIASSVVLMTQKAEKVASLEETTNDNAKRVAAKELDESTITFLRNRQEYLRIISHLESKLEGKAKEVEVLQHYHSTMPCMFSKKRKRNVEDGAAASAASSENVGPAA